VTEFDTLLRQAGAAVDAVEAPGWDGAVKLFVPIQASDAARNHASFLVHHREEYDPALLERFALGAAVTPDQLKGLRAEREAFCRDSVEALFQGRDFLLVPAAPVVRLRVGEDHRNTRPRLLRYTAPASLGGLPVLTVPWVKDGVPSGGFQVLARRGDDARLWAFADWLSLRWS
jgi:amidase/aspartyl-tRNA(Asn)/glutamyl-tRNA(Gln) amidotransferase subunit A